MHLLRLKRFWAFLLLPLALGLVQLASRYPSTVESLYSRTVYPAMAKLVGGLFSLVPFSVAELLVILLPLSLLVYMVRQIVLAVRRREERRRRLAGVAATLLCVAGAGYFAFVAMCGFNYHRESFAALSGLEVRPSSVEELAALCQDLVDRANELRPLLAEDEEGVMTASFANYYDTALHARDTYSLLGEEYDMLGGYTVRPKPVLLSRGMSYLDITGVYVPFTFEANINVDVPDFWIPSTMMHELAHSKGFMREDEANFLSYLACAASDQPDFNYSGALLALVHSTNALYAADKEMFWPIGEQYGDGVRRDLAATTAYWRQFEGPVAQVSTAVNDVYLKSNHQQNGVKSYGRMIDLLLADYRRRQADG